MSANAEKQSAVKTDGSSADIIIENMKEFYGKTIQSSYGFETIVTRPGGPWAKPHVTEAIEQVHKDIENKYFGCGLTIPDKTEGLDVLDLGSGSGLDCFVMSKLVGKNGSVTGLDMTEEQVALANKYVGYHSDLFGYKTPNLKFIVGYVEKLSDAGIKANSVDAIISNGVIVLSTDKMAVFTEAYEALKEGGEMLFSDLNADRQVPQEHITHKTLWGEGMAGALWWPDMYTLAEKVGFSTPMVVWSMGHTIKKGEYLEMIDGAEYVAVTYRLFKLPKTKQGACIATYKGTIPKCEEELVLDPLRKFKKGVDVLVNSEVATILKSSRFAEDFTFKPTSANPGAEKIERVDPFADVQK